MFQDEIPRSTLFPGSLSESLELLRSFVIKQFSFIAIFYVTLHTYAATAKVHRAALSRSLKSAESSLD
jgi:hypothetical protein